MIALISPVTYVWPALTSEGGCSETLPFGSIHDTAGSVPFCAAVKNLLSDWTLATWPSGWTSVKCGSGFQTPGVVAPWGTDVHTTAESFSQSGSVPLNT